MSPVLESVGALRKHAGGMFLASDLGGYAAVASILASAALSGERIATPVCGLARNDRFFNRLRADTPRALVPLRSTALVVGPYNRSMMTRRTI